MALYSGVVPIFMHLINTMKQYHKKKHNSKLDSAKRKLDLDSLKLKQN